jgi:2-methylcitrate dehydratase PrpD
MEIARELGRRVAAFDYRSLPPEAVYWAKVGLLDTLGVTLAGGNTPAARLLFDTLAPSDGPALVFGSDRRINVLDAAAVNGTASHALDFDDCNNTIGGHPSVPIIPGLIAVAEECGASGADVITAYVAGFEAETRVARAVNFHHYEKGWHPTATLGIFGAAAAASRLMGLDAERTGVAIAIAASLAAGLKANFGTMVKPLHVGHCARNGLFAARLARSGYDARPDVVFEHKQGFFEVFNGAGNYDASKVFADWASPLDLLDPGIAIKQYPCCGSTHPALDAMLSLKREHRIDPDDVAKIEGWIHKRRLAHTNRPDPRTALDAKFSLQYCLARAVVDGRVILEDFEGDNHADPRVHALLPRITVAAYDDTRFDPSNHFGGEVHVTLKGGRVLRAKVEQPLGRTTKNPLPPALLRAKFEACASRALPQDRVSRLAEALERFETYSDIRDVTALAEVPRSSKQAAA